MDVQVAHIYIYTRVYMFKELNFNIRKRKLLSESQLYQIFLIQKKKRIAHLAKIRNSLQKN